jgi:hypothetical protein
MPTERERLVGSDRAPRSPAMDGSPRIEELLAEARYQRHRYDLYRAKMYGMRPTTMARLRELERAYHGAEARLRRAQQQRGPQNSR